MSDLVTASTRGQLRRRLRTPWTTSVLALGWIAAASSACANSQSGDPPSEPTSNPAAGAPPSASATLPGGLTQTVTITPSSPRSGENVTVRSVLRHGGSAPTNVESRICTLGFEGTLKLELPPDMGVCAGFSQHRSIAPGDSVVAATLQRVASPPGTYVLVVRHSLAPEGAAQLQVTVR